MKIIKHLLLVLVACLTLVVVSSCETSTSGIASISLDSDSFETEFAVGSFDIRNARIIVSMKDGSNIEMNVTYDMLTTEDIALLSATGKHTISITYAGLSVPYTFTVVSPTEESVMALVAAAEAKLSMGTEAFGDFILTTYLDEIDIEWESDNQAIEVRGSIATVKRPDISEEDAVVTLTATFKKYGFEFKYEYVVLVPKFTQEDFLAYVNQIANGIVVSSTVNATLVLPFEIASSGIEIVWSSNNPAITINNETKTVIVDQSEVNVEVTLTFKIYYKGIEFTGFAAKVVTVLSESASTPAPAPTNLVVNANTLTFVKPSGVSTFNIYIDGLLATTISTNSINLLTIVTQNGSYTIGVQSVASGSYNVDSAIVTTAYTKNEIGYSGTYYNGVDLNQRGTTLLTSLRSLITTTHKNRRTYENLKTDIETTDASLTNPSKVVLIYSRLEVQGKWSSGGKIWNREHVWPQSVGWSDSTIQGSDLHHLRPEDPSVNGTRGNHPFGKVTGGKLVMASATNGGVSSNCYYASGVFEPRNEAKGDVARILFYMICRYSEAQAKSITVVATSMNLLLEWNTLDPVDTWEMTRNNLTQTIQGNRNPFIDYSYLANQIWG